MSKLQPYKVASNGTVTHRASETILGRVYLSRIDGWVAIGVDGGRLPPNYPQARKYAARAVYEAHPIRQHDRDQARVSIEYRGQRADGVAATGVAEIHDVAAFVEERHAAGWRTLEVDALTMGSPGVERRTVGRIEAVDGRRTWWSE